MSAYKHRVKTPEQIRKADLAAEEKQVLNVAMSEDLHMQFKIKAAKAKKPMGRIARELIEEWVKSK